ncbi:MAG TPA: ABC transporter permease [Anaerolineales bacterium]|nr:ABC transporter permease [Anaerolineales bacterium]
MNTFKKNVREILRYPSAIIGSVVILILIGVAIYAVIAIPYQKAITLWRGGEDVWYRNPKYAAPEWIDWLSTKKQPRSFYINSTTGKMDKVVTPNGDGTTGINITYTFNYTADYFPQEMSLYFTDKFDQKQPFVTIDWLTPDGRKLRIDNFAVDTQQTFRFSQDMNLVNSLGGTNPMEALFTGIDSKNVVKGTYKVVVTGITFEPNSDISAEFVLHGTVFGLAGTDHMRRDLMVALLWGVPIALIFGLAAALGTSVLTMIIAAFGAWYGGWLDELIQRITEVNLVLPFLSILIMIGTFYSRSIWVILGATIALSIFTGAIKGYRAIFLQVRESMYIEAARAYGASDMRIVFQYLIPRMIPLLIPGLVSSVPSFVFLEASLAVLGLGDPVLPTWGKIIDDAWANGALYKGYYYWILEPAVLLMLTGLAFALLGFALDRIFNPRLRGM